jgi:hypothetical protein
MTFFSRLGSFYSSEDITIYYLTINGLVSWIGGADGWEGKQREFE